LDFDALDSENKKISRRINNQKAEINLNTMENQFKQNQQYSNQIRRFKRVGDKSQQLVLNNVLVYNDGRFRLPGTQFVSHKNFPTSGLKTGRYSRSQQSNSNISQNSKYTNQSKPQSKQSNRGTSTKKKRKPKKNSDAHNKTNSFFRDSSVGPVKLGGGHGMTGFDYKPDYIKRKYSAKNNRPGSEANAFRKVK